MIHKGGCACGALRYRADGEPFRVVVCHCKDCQLRTGSAFGIGCFFPEEKVELTAGSPKTYERLAASGNGVRTRFCPDCGSSVMWVASVLPGAVGIAGGSFDDTDWLQPKLHVWAKSAQNWTPIPDHVEVLETSNLGKSKP